ncbi:alpha/beta hydrolase [Aquihabitans daechungensis]|uniref:alpha/beta hydrolase n=1 Tax=Aquihabitans daechungensis TaxID=1052257 RepID=UPI003BA049CF
MRLGSRGSTPTTTAAPSAASCAKAGLPETVAYRSIAGVDADLLSLDIHAPARTCLSPVVLWVHGGAYVVGDKSQQVKDKITLFNAKGWIFVSVNYRLTKTGSPTSAQFPDHYEDVAAAVAWVHRSIRDYGGDPARLALLGHSAGADIVANVGDEPPTSRLAASASRPSTASGRSTRPASTRSAPSATASRSSGRPHSATSPTTSPRPPPPSSSGPTTRCPTRSGPFGEPPSVAPSRRPTWRRSPAPAHGPSRSTRRGSATKT